MPSGPRSLVLGSLVLAGRPGSGKGTQAAALVDRLGYAHISTGELVRAARAEGDARGLQVAELVDAGMLVPDDIVLALLAEAVERIPVTRGVVFDGFPRTPEQADALDALRPIDLAIELEVPARRVAERLASRNRPDDDPPAIEARLRAYDEVTHPMLRRFAVLDALATIDGDRLPPLVTDDILATLRDHVARTPCGFDTPARRRGC